MDSFAIYFQEGFFHITDLKGIDHILFIAAACLTLNINDLKKIIFTVTSFTIGHSLSLVLSIYDLIFISSKIIEWLIPITIMLAIPLGSSTKNYAENSLLKKTVIIGLFGIVHGVGFSNYLKAMMGIEENILLPLFAFNIGLEIGQLIIVAFVLFLNFTVIRIFKTNQHNWVLFGGGIIFGLACRMCIERWPF
jgi:hypothetical protein